MDAETIISAAAIALFLMCAAFFLTAFRVIRGPTLPDRIVALDMLVAIAIGFIAVIAIKTGFNLLSTSPSRSASSAFLATVAFARFVMRQGMEPGEEEPASPPRGRDGRAASGGCADDGPAPGPSGGRHAGRRRRLHSSRRRSASCACRMSIPACTRPPRRARSARALCGGRPLAGCWRFSHARSPASSSSC